MSTVQHPHDDWLPGELRRIEPAHRARDIEDVLADLADTERLITKAEARTRRAVEAVEEHLRED